MIVIVVLPLLAAVIHTAGAERYRRWVLPIASGLIAVLGLLWLIQRLGGPALLGA